MKVALHEKSKLFDVYCKHDKAIRLHPTTDPCNWQFVAVEHAKNDGE
jgi:hypothetical protein